VRGNRCRGISLDRVRTLRFGDARLWPVDPEDLGRLLPQSSTRTSRRSLRTWQTRQNLFLTPKFLATRLCRFCFQGLFSSPPFVSGDTDIEKTVIPSCRFPLFPSRSDHRPVRLITVPPGTRRSVAKFAKFRSQISSRRRLSVHCDRDGDLRMRAAK